MIYNDAKVLKIAPFFKDELNDFNNISSIYWYINETVNHLVCMSRVDFFLCMRRAFTKQKFDANVYFTKQGFRILFVRVFLPTIRARILKFLP